MGEVLSPISLSLRGKWSVQGNPTFPRERSRCSTMGKTIRFITKDDWEGKKKKKNPVLGMSVVSAVLSPALKAALGAR